MNLNFYISKTDEQVSAEGILTMHRGAEIVEIYFDKHGDPQAVAHADDTGPSARGVVHHACDLFLAKRVKFFRGGETCTYSSVSRDECNLMAQKALIDHACALMDRRMKGDKS